MIEGKMKNEAVNELADAIIELNVDNTNRMFGQSSLNNLEISEHYKTICKHMIQIMNEMGSSLKPEYDDISVLFKAIEKEFMAIHPGSCHPEDQENNKRVVQEFMHNILLKVAK